MAVQDEWMSVSKAAEEAGCSEQFIRRDLLEHLPRDASGRPTSDRTRDGRLDGWLVNGKAWLVKRSSVVALRETLSTRASRHRGSKPSAGKRRTKSR